MSDNLFISTHENLSMPLKPFAQWHTIFRVIAWCQWGVFPLRNEKSCRQHCRLYKCRSFLTAAVPQEYFALSVKNTNHKRALNKWMNTIWKAEYVIVGNVCGGSSHIKVKEVCCIIQTVGPLYCHGQICWPHPVHKYLLCCWAQHLACETLCSLCLDVQWPQNIWTLKNVEIIYSTMICT